MVAKRIILALFIVAVTLTIVLATQQGTSAPVVEPPSKHPAPARFVVDYLPVIGTADIDGVLSAQDAAVKYVQSVELAEYLASLPPPEPVRSTPLQQGPVSNNGAHSDAWWHGVAVCEQGGQNSPYFGFFSVMDGSAGGLSWDQQVAIVNGIISRYGDSAWAASCVAAGYAASPGG